MPSPRRRKIMERILDAAIKEFAEHGYINAKVENIAREAGVSTGSIYSYFGDGKLDLLLSITVRFWENLNKILYERIKNSEGPIEKLDTILLFFHEIFFSSVEGMQLARVLVSELHTIMPHPEGDLRQKRMLITEKNREFLKLLDDIIIEGQKSGKFRGDVNPSLTRQMIYGAIQLILYGLFLQETNSKENVGYTTVEAVSAIKNHLIKDLLLAK